MTNRELDSKIKRMGYSTFEVKLEKPNYYQLEDKTILKVYPILNNLFMDKGKNPEGASVSTQNVVSAFVPEKLIGKPGPLKQLTIDAIAANIDKMDMSFDVISEHFNEYVVDNKWLLSVKTTLSQVNRSKFRNNAGEPIYHVNTTPVVKLKPKRR